MSEIKHIVKILKIKKPNPQREILFGGIACSLVFALLTAFNQQQTSELNPKPNLKNLAKTDAETANYGIGELKFIAPITKLAEDPVTALLSPIALTQTTDNISSQNVTMEVPMKYFDTKPSDSVKPKQEVYALGRYITAEINRQIKPTVLSPFGNQTLGNIAESETKNGQWEVKNIFIKGTSSPEYLGNEFSSVLEGFEDKENIILAKKRALALDELVGRLGLTENVSIDGNEIQFSEKDRVILTDFANKIGIKGGTYEQILEIAKMVNGITPTTVDIPDEVKNVFTSKRGANMELTIKVENKIVRVYSIPLLLFLAILSSPLLLSKFKFSRGESSNKKLKETESKGLGFEFPKLGLPEFALPSFKLPDFNMPNFDWLGWFYGLINWWKNRPRRAEDYAMDIPESVFMTLGFDMDNYCFTNDQFIHQKIDKQAFVNSGLNFRELIKLTNNLIEKEFGKSKRPIDMQNPDEMHLGVIEELRYNVEADLFNYYNNIYNHELAPATPKTHRIVFSGVHELVLTREEFQNWYKSESLKQAAIIYQAVWIMRHRNHNFHLTGHFKHMDLIGDQVSDRFDKNTHNQI